MKNFTPEMIEKARNAKTAEELLAHAKANGVEITADEAVTYFAQLNPKSGELDDAALDNVAGGCSDSSYIQPQAPGIPTKTKECPYCRAINPAKFDSLTVEYYIDCFNCKKKYYFH